MAKATPTSSSSKLFKESAKRKRKGISSKKKSSKSKNSKNYVKSYVGQGR
jgi:hypothetical protein